MEINGSEQADTFSVEERGDTHRIILKGTANLEIIQDLHKAALQLTATPGTVVVDWSEAEYVDTCVLQELIALRTALENVGGHFETLAPNPQIAQYLSVSGLERYFLETSARA